MPRQLFSLKRHAYGGNLMLTRKVMDDEIWQTVQQLPLLTSQRLDDIQTMFYKKMLAHGW